VGLVIYMAAGVFLLAAALIVNIIVAVRGE
jgi:hypothetical protein